ncbi:MAG: S41 family peptidase [Planctomycetota bacterium]|nr:S41 family peptidase [Planctomycetota bacterium]
MLHRLFCLSSLLVLTVIAVPVAADDKDDQYYELMRVFVDTFDNIDKNYVSDVDRRVLIEAAIRGMLQELDQYSSYIPPEEVARFTQDVDQEFGGIGIQVSISPETRRLTVTTPLPGTPAYKAGVLAGDTIMEIEGKDTAGFAIGDAVKLLKGPPGQEVSIGVRHVGSNETVTIKVERAIIQVATVLGDTFGKGDSWEFMLDDKKKIGYIRMSSFGRRTAEELHEALESLQARGLKGLILDLRFNPGGLLSQAREVSNLFIEKGVIVSTKGRSVPERIFRADKPGTFSKFPIAMLVNRYSASASEIVSACLQDHERAVIIGERTWGKGSVQNVIQLEGGDSALKLTTASYHRPSGKNIHRKKDAKETDEWGVSPNKDFEVRFSPKEMRDYLEYRRNRDVISKDGPPKSEFKDSQLQKAVDYLTAELNPKKDKPTDKPKPDVKKTEKKTDKKPAPKDKKKTDAKKTDVKKTDAKKTDVKKTEKPAAKDGKTPDAKKDKDKESARIRRGFPVRNA